MALILMMGLYIPLSSAQSKADHLEAVDKFLSTYVSQGRIDYASIKNDPSQLQSLTDQIAQLDFAALGDDERLAFLINSYNLFVIAGVVERYPVESPLDINNFFDRKVYQLGNDKVSLNQIEKQHILARYGDARVHFALVCGALGCPVIRDDAYRPDRVDAQLDEQTSQALSDDDFIRLQDGVLYISQIFEWYIKDFGGNKSSALDYIRSHTQRSIPADVKVKFYEYDWTLNDL